MKKRNRQHQPMVHAAPRPQIQSTQQTSVVTFSTEMFAGPLPHPDILRGYNEVVPGAAKMILDKFEAQSDHRRALEKMVVRGNIVQAYIGQICAFILLGGMLAAGVYLIIHGFDIGGLGTIVAAMVTGIVVFLKGRASRANELEQKRGDAARGH